MFILNSGRAERAYHSLAQRAPHSPDTPPPREAGNTLGAKSGGLRATKRRAHMLPPSKNHRNSLFPAFSRLKHPFEFQSAV
jgi:hypothetical protein